MDIGWMDECKDGYREEGKDRRVGKWGGRKDEGMEGGIKGKGFRDGRRDGKSDDEMDG